MQHMPGLGLRGISCMPDGDFGNGSRHNWKYWVGNIGLGVILKAGLVAEGTSRSRWLWADPKVGIRSGAYL